MSRETPPKKLAAQRENPTSLRYRGITLVPGGFFAAEALYRSHAENADIGTSWASLASSIVAGTDTSAPGPALR